MEKEKTPAELWASRRLEAEHRRNDRSGGKVMSNAVQSEANVESDSRRHE